MGEQYKGKPCVYCYERTSIKQGDHVFARCFFLEVERTNPIKVPSCNECNNEKSRLEHYLASLLPFGSMQSDAKERLSKLVPDRLAKNQKLTRELRAGMKDIWYSQDNGTLTRRSSLPFDGKCYAELFKYIAKALVWYHWRTFITKDSFVYSISLTSFGSEAFQTHLSSLQRTKRVENTIGNRTVWYTGLQDEDDKQLTIWEFEVFNGLVVASINGDKGFHKSSRVAVITGPLSQEKIVAELFEE